MSDVAKLLREKAKLQQLLEEYPSGVEDLSVRVARVSQNVFPNIPPGSVKTQFLMDLLNYNPSEDNIFAEIFPGEIAYIQNVPTDIQSKKILYALLIWQKSHPHPSMWINFEFEKILSIMFDDKEMSHIKRDDLFTLSVCGLDFRIVGSKSAILCYKLPDGLYKENTQDKPLVVLTDKNSCRQSFREFIASV